MSKSSQRRLNTRTLKKQVSFNQREALDIKLIEEQDGISIQEFIRASIKARAQSLREEKVE